MRKAFAGFPAIILLAFFIFSCSNKNLSAPKSRLDLLTRSQWYFAKYEQKTDNNPWIDNSASIPICRKDNFFMFQLNNILVMDEGQSKCSSSDPQTSSSPWRFADDNTKIIVTLNTGESSFTIEQLDETTLSYWISYENAGITYFTRYTFHR